ncbi:MAG: PAC2 family protein, partial [Candidatus Thermoplasmatota archaeon]|nr:PAC2 family protein [Candidatus Thermoplasmatota archaeon]
GLELLRKLGIQPVEDGMVAGLSAALLYDSEHMGLNTLCLLSETQPDHPDARAAARIVSVLDALIPDIPLETGPLLQEAEAIEAQVNEIRATLAAKQREQAVGPEGPMYL